MSGTTGTFERVQAAADAIAAQCGAPPQVAVVLGSGLGAFAEALAHPRAVEYAALPHWPVSAVPGHPGRLTVGTLAGRRVAALAGRVHLYEGHDAGAVAFGARVMGRLGVRQLVLTNAAGAVNTRFTPGTLMIIDDHINLLGANPLTGANDERFGPRFPDMTDVYSARLRRLADEAAASRRVAVAHGVYAACAGPSYETPAEIRYLRTIGADAVGMSTVPEAIAARHIGLEVAGISCITNMAAGILPQPLEHDEVLAAARRAQGALTALLEGFVARL